MTALTTMMSWTLFALLVSLSIVTGDTEPQSHVVLIPPGGFNDFINGPSVSLVFFCKSKNAHQSFLKEYEKSAKFLEAYDIRLALYDCSSPQEKEAKCEEEKSDTMIFTYQAGTELLSLELETMFDVNAIMSHALELALLQEVPIISSNLEKRDLEKSLAGHQDIILAYFPALGTQESRIFFEIAYAFQDKFKFAVTTAVNAVHGLSGFEEQQSFGFWVLFCSETKEDEISEEHGCVDIQYRGMNTLAAMALFVQELQEKTTIHCPYDDSPTLPEVSSRVPLLYLYKNQETDEEAKPVIKYLARHVRGLAKVIILDVDQTECNLVAESHGHPEKLPTLSLQKKDGEIVFMDTSIELTPDNVAYLLSIDNNVFVDRQAAGSSGEDQAVSQESEADSLDKLVEEVETQDDEVADSVFHLSESSMEKDLVPSLSIATFAAALKDAPFKLILFYLPFESVGVAFQQDLGVAMTVLAERHSQFNVLAQVNCYDATDLCAQENITTYPTLRFYNQQSHKPQTYLGPLDSTAIVNAVMLSKVAKPLPLNSDIAVEDFLSGEYPFSFKQFSPASFLLLSSGKGSDAAKVFKEASQTLSTIAPFGIIDGELATRIGEIYKTAVPSVIARNRQDPNEPVRRLTSLDLPALQDFVKQSVIPAVPELTVLNFPTLHSRGRPMVILFVDKDDASLEESLDALTDVVMGGTYSHLTFSWINAASKSMGEKILSAYTATAILPVMSVVNHNKGEVFTYQPEGKLTAQGIQDWMQRVAAEKEKPSRLLYKKEWGPPGRAYDFLTMIETEQAQDKKSPSEESRINKGMPIATLPDASEAKPTRPEPPFEDPQEAETRELLFKLRAAQLTAEGKQTEAAPHHGQHTEL